MKELGFVDICFDLLRISLSELELEKVIHFFFCFYITNKLVHGIYDAKRRREKKERKRKKCTFFFGSKGERKKRKR